jgi:hypothetical protein
MLPHVVQGLRMNGTMPLLPLYACSVWTGTALPFYNHVTFGVFLHVALKIVVPYLSS